ncbi:HD domain-containing protein [Virgibacillus sp. C22-A2]|uniref:HD domain-containing protein n=1 Tax=Virgibacillus tibetensis TaxID=3042313 RepID=A0ABU6KHN6_9BACI|nr:HD domain-containing protein [Virgibacillus sp. C22-A2]
MAKYSLEELAATIEKNANIVDQWFEEMEASIGHYIPEENGYKIYDEEDQKIASYIAEKREEKRSFKDIFNMVEKKFSLKRKEIPTEKESSLIEEENSQREFSTIEEGTLDSLGRDPESLFYEIAQDNEIIHIFKYHSLRVMFLASTLAKKMGCYDEDLRVAALLHDIGKMGISRNILLKPERLSELEYTIIQSHSHVGNVIVRKHLGLTKAAKFIRDHHERWDGKGYPRRLLGDEITVQGRIISICDAFDAMTIDQRNYKSSTLSYEEAFNELQRCSWTQFDGNLVSIFIDMMNEVTIPDYMIQEL